MTLTFHLDLTLTLSLTFDLDHLKKQIFTSYVKTDGRIQNRRSIRNICQPTRSLYTSGSKVMAYYVIFTDFFKVT